MDSSPHHGRRRQTPLEDHYGEKLQQIEEKIVELGDRREEKEADVHVTQPPFS